MKNKLSTSDKSKEIHFLVPTKKSIYVLLGVTVKTNSKNCYLKELKVIKY